MINFFFFFFLLRASILLLWLENIFVRWCDGSSCPKSEWSCHPSSTIRLRLVCFLHCHSLWHWLRRGKWVVMQALARKGRGAACLPSPPMAVNSQALPFKKSDDAMYYLPGKEKCQAIWDRYKNRDSMTFDFELRARLANKLHLEYHLQSARSDRLAFHVGTWVNGNFYHE